MLFQVLATIFVLQEVVGSRESTFDLLLYNFSFGAPDPAVEVVAVDRMNRTFVLSSNNSLICAEIGAPMRLLSPDVLAAIQAGEYVAAFDTQHHLLIWDDTLSERRIDLSFDAKTLLALTANSSRLFGVRNVSSHGNAFFGLSGNYLPMMFDLITGNVTSYCVYATQDWSSLLSAQISFGMHGSSSYLLAGGDTCCYNDFFGDDCNKDAACYSQQFGPCFLSNGYAACNLYSYLPQFALLTFPFDAETFAPLSCGLYPIADIAAFARSDALVVAVDDEGMMCVYTTQVFPYYEEPLFTGVLPPMEISFAPNRRFLTISSSNATVVVDVIARVILLSIAASSPVVVCGSTVCTSTEERIFLHDPVTRSTTTLSTDGPASSIFCGGDSVIAVTTAVNTLYVLRNPYESIILPTNGSCAFLQEEHCVNTSGCVWMLGWCALGTRNASSCHMILPDVCERVPQYCYVCTLGSKGGQQTDACFENEKWCVCSTLNEVECNLENGVCQFENGLCLGSNNCFSFVTYQFHPQPYLLACVGFIKDVIVLVGLGLLGPILANWLRKLTGLVRNFDGAEILPKPAPARELYLDEVITTSSGEEVDLDDYVRLITKTVFLLDSAVDAKIFRQALIQSILSEYLWIDDQVAQDRLKGNRIPVKNISDLSWLLRLTATHSLTILSSRSFAGRLAYAIDTFPPIIQVVLYFIGAAVTFTSTLFDELANKNAKGTFFLQYQVMGYRFMNSGTVGTITLLAVKYIQTQRMMRDSGQSFRGAIFEKKLQILRSKSTHLILRLYFMFVLVFSPLWIAGLVLYLYIPAAICVFVWLLYINFNRLRKRCFQIVDVHLPGISQRRTEVSLNADDFLGVEYAKNLRTSPTYTVIDGLARLLWQQEIPVVLITLIIQMSFNHAVLFLNRNQFNVSYWQVIELDWMSRSMGCFATLVQHGFESPSQALQFLSNFVPFM